MLLTPRDDTPRHSGIVIDRRWIIQTERLPLVLLPALAACPQRSAFNAQVDSPAKDAWMLRELQPSRQSGSAMSRATT